MFDRPTTFPFVKDPGAISVPNPVLALSHTQLPKKHQICAYRKEPDAFKSGFLDVKNPFLLLLKGHSDKKRPRFKKTC